MPVLLARGMSCIPALHGRRILVAVMAGRKISILEVSVASGIQKELCRSQNSICRFVLLGIYRQCIRSRAVLPFSYPHFQLLHERHIQFNIKDAKDPREPNRLRCWDLPRFTFEARWGFYNCSSALEEEAVRLTELQRINCEIFQPDIRASTKNTM